MTLGQKLKKLRSEKSLTQKDLAERLHVTFQTVSKWEKDENEPDISTLKELAKLYDCSIDYLVSEDEEKKEGQMEVVPTPVVAPQENITKTIVIHQKELHVCEKCKKDIPDDQLEMEEIMVHPPGRGRLATYRQGYYHKSCLDQIRRERAIAKAKEDRRKLNTAKKKSFGWGIAGGIIALVIALLVTLIGGKNDLHPVGAVFISIGIGYAAFADIYCIISGSYIGDVFLAVASWSIKFPGIIFSWDIEGFIFLIAMKILFAVLGFFIGLITLFFAVVISAGLAAVSFPFVLIHNEHTQYVDYI